jgi:ketosteroid isomerase-like protein
VEETRRDAGVNLDADLIRHISEAVEARDMSALSEGLHPDVVWEHNIGVGTPEEGVYRGRESVLRLFKRITETWEYLRPVQHELSELAPGTYHVRGALHVKHLTSEVEMVTPYEQRIEVRDGLVTKGRMINDQSADGTRLATAEPEGAS